MRKLCVFPQGRMCLCALESLVVGMVPDSMATHDEATKQQRKQHSCMPPSKNSFHNSRRCALPPYPMDPASDLNGRKLGASWDRTGTGRNWQVLAVTGRSHWLARHTQICVVGAGVMILACNLRPPGGHGLPHGSPSGVLECPPDGRRRLLGCVMGPSRSALGAQ